MKEEETEEDKRIRDKRFIEKFFTERELVVKHDKTNKSDSEAAYAWYEAVEKTISTLSTYQHDNVGQPVDDTKTANTASDSSDKMATSSDTESGVWFFRGQKDVRFAFNSTLYRRLLDASSDKLLIKTPSEHEKAMLNAELRLLDKAREMGIGRGLTALETLTLLQHHGSPTRLIDVTSDWKVALYFACESDDDRDGRVFLVKLNSDRWRTFPKAARPSERDEHPVWENYTDNFSNATSLDPNYSWLSGTWPILLPFSDPRMISQRGFFLVGGVPSPKGKGNLYTTSCSKCSKKACFCEGNEIAPRTEITTEDMRRRVDAYVTTDEIRMITSITIKFAADRKFFNDISKARLNSWTAVGYSIRVRKEYKRTLREILRKDGVHTDSIYPPLRETVRLFEYVVNESLKK